MLGRAAVSPESETSLLAQYLRQILARKWTVLALALLGCAIGFGASFLQRPVYRAKAVLDIFERRSNSLQGPGVFAAPGSRLSQEAHIQTQVNLLQSRTLLSRVPKQLAPDARTSDKPDVETLVKNLVVEPIRGTSLVELQYDAPSRAQAVDVVNTVANEYIAQELETRVDENKKTRAGLSTDLREIGQKLEESEQKLQQYASKTGLLLMAETNNVNEEKLKQLENELSQLQSVRVGKQSQYEAASRYSADALPQTADNGPLREQQAKLVDLRRELADLSAVMTPAHDRVKRVRAQIANLEGSVEKEQSRSFERVRGDYETAIRNEALMQDLIRKQSGLVSSQAAKAIHYGVLKREVATNRNLFDAMLQALKESGVDPSLRAAGAKLVDAGNSPERPYKPKPLLNALAGLFAGLIGGALLVTVRLNSDRTLRSPGAAPSVLHLSELGVIPSFKAVRGGSAEGREGPGLKLISDGAEFSPKTGTILAEAYRATSMSILFSANELDNERVIVVTSPNPGEGKSTTVSNLGMALASMGKRVLLIGADIHSPRLHKMFDLPNTVGLTDLIGRARPVSEFLSLVLPTKIAGLSVLPSGSKPKSIDTAALDDFTALADVLQRAREHFDIVLIDTPPLLLFSDARILGRLADGVVLVLRSGQTTRDSAQAVKQRFTEDGTYVLGTILTDWDPSSGTPLDSYSAHYYAYGRRHDTA